MPWRPYGTEDSSPAVLAHSSYVRGIGTFRNGVARDRIEVILASGISERECLEVNLEYQDPNGITVDDYVGLETEGVMLVPEAGEVLYWLADGSVPDIDKP